MFERFTEPARMIVVLAQEQARSLRHDYIGTEHLLLGLLREEEGLGARVLASLGVTAERVRAQIVRLVEPGAHATTSQIPFTPRATKVLELALRESLELGHDYIDTEHILLGLVAEGEGVAVRVLDELGVDGASLRDAVLGQTATGAGQLIAREAAARAVQTATEIAGAGGRPVDAGDLIVALALGDELAGAVLGRYVSLEDLQDALEAARRESQA